MGESTIAQRCRDLIAASYRASSFEGDLITQAQDVSSHLQNQVDNVAASPNGTRLIQKYTLLAKAVSSKSTFLDMVKIIWRMVKAEAGSPEYKLLLFTLGVSTVVCSVQMARAEVVDTWVEIVQSWLGKQLTLGGKGVAGEGEGSVVDRIKRFFSTPYLHDFD